MNLLKVVSNKKVYKVFLWLASIIVAYHIGRYLDIASYAPEVYVETIQPHLEEDLDGLYIPIYFSNIGEKEVKDLWIDVKTCYMDDPLSIKIGNLPAQSGKSLERFYEPKTIQILEEKSCPFRGSKEPTCQIEAFTDGTNVIVPTQNCSFYMCNQCNYTLEAYGKNYSKSVNGSFFAPTKFVYQVEQIKNKSKKMAIEPKEFKKLRSVGLSIFGSNEKCNWRAGDKCNYTQDELDQKTISKLTIKIPGRTGDLLIPAVVSFKEMVNQSQESEKKNGKR